ncbi:hypothetical protein LEP1GSC043_0511 [Leptospira weilii str. Ecochallenge]|nr:hypothetical protein LEP1GSC108_4844 [Leptospira weilii str. UI 13098]EMY14768.1 hypothetical protein LEP1GSC043_0511 [Leptospira weilii str. Ecochallenge]
MLADVLKNMRIPPVFLFFGRIQVAPLNCLELSIFYKNLPLISSYKMYLEKNSQINMEKLSDRESLLYDN